MTWDEEVIAEHDKERGTRMIINEPKTPYNRLGLPEGGSALLFCNTSDPSLEEPDMRQELLDRLLALSKPVDVSVRIPL